MINLLWHYDPPTESFSSKLTIKESEQRHWLHVVVPLLTTLKQVSQIVLVIPLLTAYKNISADILFNTFTTIIPLI